MSMADFYLHKAAHCEMLARVAANVTEREEYLEAARQYRRAAERVEADKFMADTADLPQSFETTES